MTDLGKIAYVPKGDYSAAAQYEYLDVVHYNGASYSAKRATTGHAPTTGKSDDTYWQLMVSPAAGVFRPMGTVAFASLPTEPDIGDCYNISDSFTTDNRFKEGSGIKLPAGTNVYYTTDGYWDVLAGKPIVSTINGMKIDGTDNVNNYGVCSTAAATAAKTVSITGNFSLVTGAEVTVKFSNSNSATNPTLNVNSTGAKAIYFAGAAVGTSDIVGGLVYSFRYNGTQWDLVGGVSSGLTSRVSTVESGKAAKDEAIKNITRSGTTFTATRADGTTFTFTQQDSNTTTGDGIKTKVAKTGSGTTVTNTVAASTTLDNTVGTLLNNDYAINNAKAPKSEAIKSITRSGTTFTATRCDDTTFTFTQQDNNTWTAMTGATSSANGTVGYVNAVPPKDGYDTKFLRADGTWAKPANTWTAMVGATSSANGSVGYVNAVPPKDGYNTKYLRADGTWTVPPNTTTGTTYTAGDVPANTTFATNGSVKNAYDGLNSAKQPKTMSKTIAGQTTVEGCLTQINADLTAFNPQTGSITMSSYLDTVVLNQLVKIGNIIELKLDAARTTYPVPKETLIATIPVGFHPTSILTRVPCVVRNTANGLVRFAWASIESNGIISISHNSTDAENLNQLELHVVYFGGY